MNILTIQKFSLYLALLFTCLLEPVLATGVYLDTIEQPINLVAASDPSSIPLGAVVCE